VDVYDDKMGGGAAYITVISIVGSRRKSLLDPVAVVYACIYQCGNTV